MTRASGRATLALQAPTRALVWQCVFVLAFILCWIVAARNLPVYVIPGPQAVALDMMQFVLTPALRASALASLYHVCLAVLLAFFLGGVLASIAETFPVFRALIHRRISPFFNAFSGIGWALLAVLWFGVSQLTVVFSVTVVLLPFSLINIREGLASLDRETVEMARSFSRHPLRTARLVLVPLLLPFLIAALRISFGVGWKVALTAELLAGDRGLGYVMNIAMQEQDTTRVIAISLIIVAFVRVVDKYGFEHIQRKLSMAFRSA